jgi:hypothetical protein
MIDGMIKLAWRGASTTLQKIRRASAASLTCWFTVSLSVAAMASQQLSSSEGINSPAPGLASVNRPTPETGGEVERIDRDVCASIQQQTGLAFGDIPAANQ